MGAGALAPGRVCIQFSKDKGFKAFEMREKIEFSLKWLGGRPTRAGRKRPRLGLL